MCLLTPSTSTLGWPRIVPLCLDPPGDSNCLCVGVSKHTHTHGLGQLPLTNSLSSFTLKISGYESPFESKISKTHMRRMMTFSLHLVWSVGHFGFFLLFLMISQHCLTFCFSSWASLSRQMDRRWPHVTRPWKSYPILVRLKSRKLAEHQMSRGLVPNCRAANGKMRTETGVERFSS